MKITLTALAPFVLAAAVAAQTPTLTRVLTANPWSVSVVDHNAMSDTRTLPADTPLADGTTLTASVGIESAVHEVSIESGVVTMTCKLTGVGSTGTVGGATGNQASLEFFAAAPWAGDVRIAWNRENSGDFEIEVDVLDDGSSEVAEAVSADDEAAVPLSVPAGAFSLWIGVRATRTSTFTSGQFIGSLTVYLETPPPPPPPRSAFLALTDAAELVRQDRNTCGVIDCTTPLAPATDPCAGGAAYDSRTRGTWVTDGVSLAKVDSRDGCTVQCAPVALGPILGGSTLATGLAHDHDRNYLYVADKLDRITTLDASTCPPAFVRQCSVPLPPQFPGVSLTGLAFDDVEDLIFVCASYCDGQSGGGAFAAVPATDPCAAAPCYQFVFPSTLSGPLSGLAFDSCTREVWLTDGEETTSLVYDGSCSQSAGASGCAKPAGSDRYVGLCLEPITEIRTGHRCANFACGACTPALHFVGDPVLGNDDFRIDATGLPIGSNAVFLLNFRGCEQVGFLLPPFCAPFHVPLTAPLLALGRPVAGASPCGGSASLPFKMPRVVGPCSFTLSTQVIGNCIPAPGMLGTFLTESVTWRVTSS